MKIPKKPPFGAAFLCSIELRLDMVAYNVFHYARYFESYLMPVRTLFDHIVLLASDLVESARWYDAFTPLLGLRKTRDHVYLHPDGWAVDLRAAQKDSAPYGRYNAGLNHIGLRVGTCDEVMAVRDAFAASGFEVPEPQIFDEEETVVFFKDPDGVRWEIGHEIEART